MRRLIHAYATFHNPAVGEAIRLRLGRIRARIANQERGGDLSRRIFRAVLAGARAVGAA